MGLSINANDSRANSNVKGLCEVLNDLLSKYQDIIIMGDFNVVMLTRDNNTLKFMGLLNTHGSVSFLCP